MNYIATEGKEKNYTIVGDKSSQPSGITVLVLYFFLRRYKLLITSWLLQLLPAVLPKGLIGKTAFLFIYILALLIHSGGGDPKTKDGCGNRANSFC